MPVVLCENNHLFLEDMFKHNDLFGGHVTKEQLKPVLMQPPLFRGHPELTITFLPHCPLVKVHRA
jgi:hypothetical protein